MPTHENVKIERVHRLNKRDTDTCPIIVKFTKYKDRDCIFKKGRQTLRRESGYSIKEDYTERVFEHRRILGHELNAANGERAKLQYV